MHHQRPGAPAQLRILFMGGTQVMKGFREALQAFDQVCQQEPTAHLVLVGDTHPEDVIRYCSRAGLRHITPAQVECRGYLNSMQLLELFDSSTCLLHPSHLDNSPNSVCEAQVAGLPVLATDVGGVSSLVEHGRTGVLSSRNPAELAAHLLRLHQEPHWAAHLAAQARQEAHLRHDPATILERTLAIYQTVANRQLRPTPEALTYA
jgi:glycosyltransferase involved in cell wall biosynthesis